MVDAVTNGDTKTFARAADEHQKRGDLTTTDAHAIARAYIERSLSHPDNMGELTALAKAHPSRRTVESLGSCAKQVQSALELRAQIHDDAGAEALTLLADVDGVSRSSLRHFENDENPLFRALYARALTTVDDGAARRVLFIDPQVDVRRGAFLAAGAAHDARDQEGLLESARHDPDPLARSLAIRALVAQDAIAQSQADAIADLAAQADEAGRTEIALGWAQSPLFAQGGRVHLASSLSRGGGMDSLMAASVTWMIWATTDVELGNLARARLLAALQRGPSAQRMRAIAVVSLRGSLAASAPFVAALQEVAANGEPEQRVAAHARLAELPPQRVAAIAALWELAKRRDAAGLSARIALAQAGERTVQAWLENDLTRGEYSDRVAAVDGLAALGRGMRALPLLALPLLEVGGAGAQEPSPDFKVRVACHILANAH